MLLGTIHDGESRDKKGVKGLGKLKVWVKKVFFE